MTPFNQQIALIRQATKELKEANDKADKKNLSRKSAPLKNGIMPRDSASIK